MIQAVDGNPTKDLSRDEALTLMRGKAGTIVGLKVERQGKLFEVHLAREALTMRTVRAVVTSDGEGTIGYLALAQFGKKSPQEMRDAIADLLRGNAQGFVLDLRNNPGGFVPASREIASLFLDSRELIYRSFEQNGTPRELRTASPPITDKPVGS